MTLWVRRLGLIIGLAFFIFACEEPGEIGLELNPESGAFVAKFDEIPVATSIIEYEDIVSDISTRIVRDRQTGNLITQGRFLVGSYSTQDFGRFQSKAFSSLYLSLSRFRPDSTFVFDSLVLSVHVNYLYGEQEKFAGNKRIFVHELSEEVKIDSLYLTKNSTPYIEEPVGAINFDISSADTLFIDTVFTARLSDELGLRFLNKAKTDTLPYENNIEFRKFFDGFAFISDEGNEVLTGIFAESPSTYLRLYIHDADDTTFFNFVFDGRGDEGNNITRYYNNISLDKSGTPIEGITDFYTDFQTNNGLSYIQGSSGILTKLNIGSYLDFMDTIEHLVINRAELVIPVDSYNDFLEPPSALDLYISDQNNRFVENIDSIRNSVTFATIGRILYAKEISENKGQYVGDITNYIQAITSSVTSDSLLLIGQTSLWNSATRVNQMITIKDDIKLKVYYSTLQ